MKLWVMRHGFAGRGGDEWRTLKQEGIADVQLIAEYVHRHIYPFCRSGQKRTDIGIVHSPLPRCMQTAAIMGKILGVNYFQSNELLPGNSLTGTTQFRHKIVVTHDDVIEATKGVKSKPCMAEFRKYRIKKSGKFKLLYAVLPSDLGGSDVFE